MRSISFYITTLLFLGINLCAVSQQGRNNEYELYKQRADMAYKRGDYNRAIPLYRACLAVPQYDKDIYAIQQIANCNLCQSLHGTAAFLLQQQSFDEAISIMDKLLKVNPNDSLASKNIGDAWSKKAINSYQEKNYQVALQYYQNSAKYGHIDNATKWLVDSCQFYVDRNQNGYFSYEVQEQPSFKGGQSQLLKFFAKNAKYPVEAKNNNIEGKVVLGFIVKDDGKLAEIKVLRGLGYGCDEEAIRVFTSMPYWIPGKRFGKYVPVRMTFSLPFVVE